MYEIFIGVKQLKESGNEADDDKWPPVIQWNKLEYKLVASIGSHATYQMNVEKLVANYIGLSVLVQEIADGMYRDNTEEAELCDWEELCNIKTAIKEKLEVIKS